MLESTRRTGQQNAWSQAIYRVPITVALAAVFWWGGSLLAAGDRRAETGAGNREPILLFSMGLRALRHHEGGAQIRLGTLSAPLMVCSGQTWEDENDSTTFGARRLR